MLAHSVGDCTPNSVHSTQCRVHPRRSVSLSHPRRALHLHRRVAARGLGAGSCARSHGLATRRCRWRVVALIKTNTLLILCVWRDGHIDFTLYRTVRPFVPSRVGGARRAGAAQIKE